MPALTTNDIRAAYVLYNQPPGTPASISFGTPRGYHWL